MTKMKTYILALLLLVSLPLAKVSAQSDFTAETEYHSNIKPPVIIEGTAKELSKSLKGTIITLYEDPDGSKTSMVEIKKLVTKSNGKFTFNLDINKMYVLEAVKEGYTRKMVDFDTDVTMAASDKTKVPTFKFIVDMVKDLDGLDYTGSVARVFYHIRKSALDYELDYTKDEQIEEERLARLEEQRQQQAQIAAQEKFEREEAAKLLLNAEGLEAAEVIKAVVKIGGDEAKVKKSLLKIYPESDSLRTKKVDVMYAELEKEKKRAGGNSANIDFGSIFKSAQEFEVEHMKEMNAKDEARKATVLKATQEVRQAQSEALAKANASSQLEARERIATASAQEETRQKKAKAEKKDSYFQAIFSAGGNPDAAIGNLEKVFKKDPYKEEKAAAVYAEYEKMRKGGATLSGMNFDQLFAAANQAELDAFEEKEVSKDNADSARLAEFMAKVEARKTAEKEKTVRKIEAAIKNSDGERAGTIKALKAAFQKNDPYKEEKAHAIYDSYVADRKINEGGTNFSAIDFNALFEVAEQAEIDSKRQKKDERFEKKQQQLADVEAKRQALRTEKKQLGAKAEEDVQLVHEVILGGIQNKKEKELENAISRGGGDRETTIEALMETLPKDAEFKREKAEAMFDSYRVQKQTQSGSSHIRYDDLFAAADTKEIEMLEQAYEEKKADEFAHLRKYEDERIEKAEQIAQAQISKADKEKQAAEEQYLAVAKRIEEEKRVRLEEEKKVAILAQREEFEKQNERVAAERVRLDEIRANELANAKERQTQLDEAKRKEAEAEQKELDRIAADRQKQLAQLDLEKQKALDVQKKEEERLAKEALKKQEDEAKLLAKQDKAKQDAILAQKKEEERKKVEAGKLAAKQVQEKLASDNARKKETAALAAQLAKEKKKEADRLAGEEAKKQQAELARIAKQDAKKKEEDYTRYLTLGNQAFEKKDYKIARTQYDQGLAAKPDGKEIKSKVKELEVIERGIAKAEAEQQAIDNRYSKQVETAELAFEVGDYDAAISAYNRALKEKPRSKEPWERIKQIQKIKSDIASANKVAAAQEREYMLLLQDGNNLMVANKYQEAKDKFNEALALKPEESEPKSKIAKVNEQLALIADAAEKERIRKQKAKEDFEAQQADQAKRDQDAADQLAIAREARANALDEIKGDKEARAQTNLTAEENLQKLYDEALKRVAEMNLNAENQRLAFLSELAQIYPEGLTEETVNGKGFVLNRHVVNEQGVVTIYEKKIWDWGGVFYFKDTDIAITESLYKLELKAFKK